MQKHHVCTPQFAKNPAKRHVHHVKKNLQTRQQKNQNSLNGFGGETV